MTNDEPVQDWMKLGDREIEILSITPREKEKPDPSEEQQYETPLQRARRIMGREREI